MAVKLCKKCLNEKDIKDFYKHPKSKDGLLNLCKECHKENVRINRKNKAKYYREFDRTRNMLEHRVLARKEYKKTEAGAAARNRSIQRYKELNPIKRAAHVITGNAIRGGLLVKMPCEVCGAARVHAHHFDYSKPLSVNWLCPKHHKEWHENNEPING